MKKNKIVAWSYSRLNDFESCPRAFKYRHVYKMTEPKADAMMRGIKIHNEAAAYLAGETNNFPESCTNFRGEFDELRKLNPIVEQKWAFSKRWVSVSYFHKSVKSRFTLDVAHIYKDGTAEVIDHKTGKFSENAVDSYRDQMGMFAGAMCKKFAEVQHITTRLWFLDADKEHIEEWTREEALEHLAEIEQRAEKMMAATTYPPNPSWKCGGISKSTGKAWGCHWRASNGGCCEYG